MPSPDQPWGYDVRGSAEASYTPVADKQRIPVKATVCDQRVTPAAEAVIGQCAYYYRPLHEEYINKTGMATWQAIKAWALAWNPWNDLKVAKQLLQHRSALITASSTSPDWSRHANFMMRHIGCGHTPPDYYVSYGYYYCSRYGSLLRPRLSKHGQKWLDDARKNLQKNMEFGLKQNMDGITILIPCKRYPNRSVQMSAPQYKLEFNNGLFKTFAFKTHVPAYLDAGLADLPITDLMQIGAEPNIEEWLDKDTWEQALESGAEVGKEKVKDAWNSTKSTASEAWKATTQAAQATGQAVEQALQWLMQKL